MHHSQLKIKHLGIDTYKDPIIYMRRDCHVCTSEGFEVHARIRVTTAQKSIIATLNIIDNRVLDPGEASLSNYAADLLGVKEGDLITVSHAKTIGSLSSVRAKIYGHSLNKDQIYEIVSDITHGRYSDIHIAAFLTACAGGRMTQQEISDLTQAMVSQGDRLSWHSKMVVDKHCVGGIPGNRTTPIVVAIVAAYGLTMPKTSSRAITSPAGTADTMEVLAPVELSVSAMKDVVGKENGCVVWGGAVSLSPADDILIRVEKALELDSEGQLVASVLSKKIAAGSTHVLIDIPIGPTAKVRSQEMAETLASYLTTVADLLGITTKVIFSDGSEPIGRGVGPALEARDVMAILSNAPDAPQDLRHRALTIAGQIIEFAPEVPQGQGAIIADQILSSGQALTKFKAICDAQGGLRAIPTAPYTRPYPASESGIVTLIDNRRIALIAKLAGAPNDKVAGLDLHKKVGDRVEKGEPLFTVHSASPGELAYAFGYLSEGNHIVTIHSEGSS